jgi:hypothetical protein
MKGTKIRPCGTPQLISTKMDYVPLTLTNFFLPLTYDWNHVLSDTPII